MKQLLVNSILPFSGKSKSEHFILLAVALLGLLGSSYMISNCKGHNHNAFFSAQNMGNPNLIDSPINGNQLVLEISGDLQEKSPIEFSIPENLNQQKFLIDFGNGEKRIIDDENFFYSYNRPGNYKVQLLSMNDERLKMVESRNVLIAQKNNYN